MYEDIITKGSLVTTKNENGVCLLGKLEWHLNYEDKELGNIPMSLLCLTI